MSLLCTRCRTPLPLPDGGLCISCGANNAQPYLIGKLGEGEGGRFPLGVRTTLGRQVSSTIRFHDREISKEHASIEQKADGGFWVVDLSSSNGTFVNGRRIQELRLRERDEISLGASTFVFNGLEAGVDTSAKGVTVLAAAMNSTPRFLAHIDHREQNEFRPADQLKDMGELKQDYEKLRIAHEFHRQVGLERDPKSLFQKILKVSFLLLAADHGVLFLRDEKTGELNPVAVQHRKKESEPVVLSDTLLKHVTQTHQAILTADAIIDERFSSSESIVAQGIRSAMAVPLLAKGMLKGILFLDTRERTHAFSEKDLKILSGIASQAAIALENVDLAKKIESEAVARAELSRFLSPAVAEAVVAGKVELLRAGRLVEVSVLFADIRGFTSLAENEEPQQTVTMLNEFFTAMADVIFQYEGNLDKFIGDCVMAVWGPPSPHVDDAARSLHAALEMQRQIEALNGRRVAKGQKPIAVGIGVATGPAIVGYMGSTERHEFTAIGDSVNTAARLCSTAKGGDIVATDFTVAKAGGGFVVEQLPITAVKGKEKTVSTCRILKPLS